MQFPSRCWNQSLSIKTAGLVPQSRQKFLKATTSTNNIYGPIHFQMRDEPVI